MKKITALTTMLLVGVLSMQNASAKDFSLLGPFSVSADESNDRVIQLKVPNKITVGVAFKGCDIAINTKENQSGLGASVQNEGRTVIISADLSAKEKDKVYPVHILTKEGRTHTVALINQGKDYKLEDVQFKVVIDSQSAGCS